MKTKRMFILTPKQKQAARKGGLLTGIALLVMVLIPAMFLNRVPSAQDTSAPPRGHHAVVPPASQTDAGGPDIAVYLAKERRTAQVPLEDYVRGVVAAEMPIEFEPEALKAQALAARSYIVRRLQDGDTDGVPANDAVVTDTVTHQAYVADEQLQARWGDAYEANAEKLRRAVNETKDRILTYEGKPINAVFFSTSNGYTENAEDYWPVGAVPYLRSVPSPWDQKLSPRYKETIDIPYRTFLAKLGLGKEIPASTGVESIRVLDRTDGNRIKKLKIAGKLFTGREVREKLGLNSSQFEWRLVGNNVKITTYGFGHGVGMSQYGAQGMAKEGRTAEEIVKHYYTGVAIGKASDYIKPR